MVWDGWISFVFLTTLCTLCGQIKGQSETLYQNADVSGEISELLTKNNVHHRVKKASDYEDYQNDGRFENDPQFPTYSNWQPADDLGTFRINSPRRQQQEEEGQEKTQEERTPPEEVSLGGGPPPAGAGKKGQDDSYISVKLPDDIMKHLGRQYGLDKNKHVQTQILGIPSDHLESLDFDESKSKQSESHTTISTATTESSTPQDNNNQGFHNTYNDREQEYYNKKDLLPKLTKDKDTKVPDKVPEQNPVEPGTRSLWSVAWQAHIYFSGTLFILLAIYCTVNVCRLHTFSRLFSRGYFLSLNICMILIGLVRGLFLLFDPYNEGQSLPAPLAYMLLNVGYPCITSAFAILFLALLRVTQVELLSPSVQTPRALAVFCCVHTATSLALDITVGLLDRLQYILLLGQGIFIVWSLLLSAGYFYIYSTMKKVVSRQQCDLSRAMYPKLMFDQTGSGSYSMRLPTARSNPLSRAVNLSLGVAVLGSLMGGVQLYGMIGMHGLLRAEPQHIPTPWYGYQVALRVLEVMICYLLAVVATTPLRSEPAMSGSPRTTGPCTSCSPLLCCNGEGGCARCGEDRDAQELQDEIYTEICAVGAGAGGTVRMLNTGDMMEMVGGAATNTQSTNNSSMAGLSSSGTAQLTSTLLRRTAAQPRDSHVSGESGATADTALYTNLRASGSRPSSMLFNDAGFVRFRLGQDPGLAQAELLRQSCQDLVTNPGAAEAEAALPDRPGSEMKGSRSFDNAVLDKKQLSGDSFRVSPLERPQSNMSHRVQEAGLRPELGSPDRPDVELLPGLPQRPASKLATHSHPAPAAAAQLSESDTGGETYEMPAGMILPGHNRSLAAQVRSVVGYSESDLSSVDPLYSQRSVYGYSGVSRAPSRCSSISATQSFDMRVYGRTGAGLSGAATLGRPADRAKLDNKYYYCSTQARPARQRAAGAHKEQQSLTPRPLLPSQRNPRLGPSPTPPSGRQQAGGGATAAQSLYDQIMGRDGAREQQQQAAQASSPQLQNFQRSRSLGHHYQREPQQGPAHLPPRPPGPRTPTSVARKVFESVTKRRAKDKQPKARPPPAGYPGLGAGPQLLATPDGRLVAAPPGQALIQLEDGRLVPAPGPLVQLEDGRIVALAGPPPGQPPGLVQTPDGRLVMAGRARAGLQDRDMMLYGAREERRDYNQAHAMGILGDKLSYLPGEPQPQHQQEPLYERRADMREMVARQALSRQQGPQVLGTPTAGRHGGDGDRQAAARLAGQHHLASPPDLASRHRRPDTDQEDSEAGLYTETGSLADNELDSEISSVWGPGPGEARLPGLALVSPLEYAAIMKQYTEPSLVLGQDITPDSGVVVDSRHHSKERENQDAKKKREHFLASSRAAAASHGKTEAANESSESQSSDTGSSFGGGGAAEVAAAAAQRNGRYMRVPTQDTQPREELAEREPGKKEIGSRHRQPSSLSEPELVTDSEAVSETNTENSGDGAALSESEFDAAGAAELHPAAEKIATVCNEIKQRFHSERLNTDDENVI